MMFIEFHKQTNAYGDILCVPLIHVNNSGREYLATIIGNTGSSYLGSKKKLIFQLDTVISYKDVKDPVSYWVTFPYTTRNKDLIGGMIS